MLTDLSLSSLVTGTAELAMHEKIALSVSAPGSLHSTLHSAAPELGLEGMKVEEFHFQLILKIPVILLDSL